jgi:AcrR family transcriptional regulator
VPETAKFAGRETTPEHLDTAMTLETLTKRKTAIAPSSPARVPTSVAEPRRRQLIDATITAIATHGLSRTTLAKVAGLAGMTAGSVNFHFTSKEALLVATLEFLVEEHDAFMEAAVAGAGPDPAEALEALIEAQFDPAISDPRKVAVWHAFWSETRARQDYMRICGGSDKANFEAHMTLCRQIIEGGGEEGGKGGSRVMDAKAVTRGLTGLVESLWSEILATPEHYDREAAKRLCRAYLASVFPWRFEMPKGEGGGEGEAEMAAPRGAEEPHVRDEAAARRTLPAWVYDNAEFTALEREAIFRPAWHIVCHVSELPEAGSYVTLDLLGERAFVLRGKDGELRAFHNVCRHRAHAVVQGQSGRCPGVRTSASRPSSWRSSRASSSSGSMRTARASPSAWRPTPRSSRTTGFPTCGPSSGSGTTRSRSTGRTSGTTTWRAITSRPATRACPT